MRILTAAGWMLCAASAVHGEGRIVITEIMYNPAGEERKNQAEWVEIANVGDEPVAMRDWRLDDEDRDEWGAFTLTLEPGGVAVLINGDECSEEEFRQAWDAEGSPDRDYVVIAVKWGSLANTPGPDNEVLTLLDETEQSVFEVKQTGPGWPKVTDVGGFSISWTEPWGEEHTSGRRWKKSSGGLGAWACTTTEIFSRKDIGSPGLLPAPKAEAPASQPGNDVESSGEPTDAAPPLGKGKGSPSREPAPKPGERRIKPDSNAVPY